MPTGINATMQQVLAGHANLSATMSVLGIANAHELVTGLQLAQKHVCMYMSELLTSVDSGIVDDIAGGCRRLDSLAEWFRR